MQLRQIIYIAYLFILLNAATANAQIVLLDCQGITRAVHEAKGTELNKIQVEVSQQGAVPANGTEVQLTNNVTGEVYTAQASSGSAVFPSVPPGSYTMAVSGTNVTVGSITIGSTGLGAAAAGGVVAGGAVAGGGAIAGGVVAVDQIEQQISDESEPPLETPTPEPTTTPEIPIETPIPEAPSPTPTICDCEPDAEPTPIDDFFDEPAAISPFR
jgi:hypothetical protein